MARPTDLDDLDSFVFAKLPLQAREHDQDLPTLPDVPADGTGNLPAVELPESALDAAPNVPDQASLPDFFDLL